MADTTGGVLFTKKREFKESSGFPDAKRKVFRKVIERVVNDDKENNVIQYICEEEQSTRMKESFKLNRDTADVDSEMYVSERGKGESTKHQGNSNRQDLGGDGDSSEQADVTPLYGEQLFPAQSPTMQLSSLRDNTWRSLMQIADVAQQQHEKQRQLYQQQKDDGCCDEKSKVFLETKQLAEYLELPKFESSQIASAFTQEVPECTSEVEVPYASELSLGISQDFPFPKQSESFAQASQENGQREDAQSYMDACQCGEQAQKEGKVSPVLLTCAILTPLDDALASAIKELDKIENSQAHKVKLALSLVKGLVDTAVGIVCHK